VPTPSKQLPPQPRPEVPKVECRGGCGTRLRLLEAVCEPCRWLLPSDLLESLKLAQRRHNIYARWAAEDAAARWLRAARAARPSAELETADA